MKRTNRPKRHTCAPSQENAKHEASVDDESLLDDRDWELFLKASGLDGDPKAADAQARLWLRLAETLDQPSNGRRLRGTFRAGIKEAHKRSKFNRVTIEEYMSYIEGDLDIYFVNDGIEMLYHREATPIEITAWKNSLFDAQDWLIFLSPDALHNDPNAADDQARLWLRLDESLNNPQNAARLRDTFRAGIRKAQAHSAYKQIPLREYIAHIKNVCSREISDALSGVGRRRG
jgi:hypothetical protein